MPPKSVKRVNDSGKGKTRPQLPLLKESNSTPGLFRTPSGSFDAAATGEQLYIIEDILAEKKEMSTCKCFGDLPKSDQNGKGGSCMPAVLCWRGTSFQWRGQTHGRRAAQHGRADYEGNPLCSYVEGLGGVLDQPPFTTS